MKTASAQLLKAMQEERAFDYSVVVTFPDHSTLTLTEDDLAGSGCKISLSGGNSSFPLGMALCKCLSVTFFNIDDQYDDYDFLGATLTATASMDFGETVETINLGTFTVTEPEQYGATITVVGYDDFYKADKTYETLQTFPMTAQQLFVDACQKASLTPLSANFPNADYSVEKMPTNATCRQVIGMIAALAGGNAVVNGSNVSIITYDAASIDIFDVVDGGTFAPWTTGEEISGGTFSPWTTGDPEDGGTFAELSNIQLFTDVFSQSLSTDDIVITGIRLKENEDEYLAGTEGYVIDIDSQLAGSTQQNFVNRIGNILIGLKFRSFEISIPSYPLAEFGDIVFLRKNDTIHGSFLTDIEFAFKGATVLKCTADSPVRNSSKGYTAQSAAYRQLREVVNAEKTARETAMAGLVSALTTGSGMYFTEDVQADGSSIYYMHDAASLTNSHTVLKIANGTIGMTKNYQGASTVWTFGAQANGTIIAQLMDVIGINFEWGTGGTLTLGGQNNINGNLRMLNASGQEIGQWNKDGITAMNVTAYGSLICYESYTIVPD